MYQSTSPHFSGWPVTQYSKGFQIFPSLLSDRNPGTGTIAELKKTFQIDKNALTIMKKNLIEKNAMNRWFSLKKHDTDQLKKWIYSRIYTRSHDIALFFTYYIYLLLIFSK